MNIIIFGTEGYTKKFSANNTKCEFIAMGLLHAGCKVALLDNLFGTKEQCKKEIGISKSGIRYCLLPRKHKYLAFIYNIPHIWKFLKDNYEPNDINHVILTTGYFPFYVLLAVLTQIAGYTRSIHITEWDLAFKQNSLLAKLNSHAIDWGFGYFVEMILPISHFLMEKSLKFKKPAYLLPVLASYERYVNETSAKTHFTFCGHIRYLLRNRLILEAFKDVHQKHSHVQLVLVLNGNDKDFEEIKILLKHEQLTDEIEIKTQLSQTELYEVYDSSIALLIPLDPDNLQDKARFSQKIAEYVASKRPIITSAAGEIPYYFKDNENAVVVSFNKDGYADGMNRMIEDQTLSDDIGKNGFNVGRRYFDYENVGEHLKDAIIKVLK